MNNAQADIYFDSNQKHSSRGCFETTVRQHNWSWLVLDFLKNITFG